VREIGLVPARRDLGLALLRHRPAQGIQSLRRPELLHAPAQRGNGQADRLHFLRVLLPRAYLVEPALDDVLGAVHEGEIVLAVALPQFVRDGDIQLAIDGPEEKALGQFHEARVLGLAQGRRGTRKRPMQLRADLRHAEIGGRAIRARTRDYRDPEKGILDDLPLALVEGGGEALQRGLARRRRRALRPGRGFTTGRFLEDVRHLAGYRPVLPCRITRAP